MLGVNYGKKCWFTVLSTLEASVASSPPKWQTDPDRPSVLSMGLEARNALLYCEFRDYPEWAEMVRESEGRAHGNAEIIGQAIAGALHLAGWESHRAGRSREELVKQLTAFLTRALRPE